MSCELEQGGAAGGSWCELVIVWRVLLLCMVLMTSVIDDLERDKSIRWMPWHQEAMKDVARCEKSWGAASRL